MDGGILDHFPLRWIPFVLRWRWVFAALGLALFAVALPPSRRVKLDRSITSMFHRTDPTLIDYQVLQREFGGNAVVLLVYRDPELMTPEGIGRNAMISKRVEQVEGVKGVLSPSRLSEAIEIMRPPLPFAGPTSELPPLLRDDAIARQFVELFAGYTHSSDGKHGAVVAILEPDPPRETIEAIRAVAGSLDRPLQPGWIVGEPVLIHDGFDLIERDGALLATWTIGLLGIVLLIAVGNLRFVALGLFAIVWSDALTRAVMVWAEVELSLVSTILIAVIAVIAVATVLHLGVRWSTQRRRGHQRFAASAITLALLAAPIAWTCATDAAGFAALGISQIEPVRQFGWIIAVAAAFILVSLVCFAPLLMAVNLTGETGEKFEPRRSAVGGGISRVRRRVDRAIRKGAIRLAAASVRTKGLVIAATAVVSLAALLQTLRTETETSFLNNFRPESPVVRAYARVEQEFGGAGVWDVVLDAPPVISREYLEQVRGLEEDLRGIDQEGARLTKVLSLADAEAITSQVPLLALATPAMRLAGMRVAMPVFHDALLSGAADDDAAGDSAAGDSATGHRQGGRKLRIMLRSREQLTAESKRALIAEVERIVRERTRSEAWRSIWHKESGGDRPSADEPPSRDGEGTVKDSLAAPTDSGRVTGYYVMMARLVDRLVQDQWRCFIVAVLAVFLLLALATRSWRLAAAALVPNLAPVLVVLAISGAFGGKLNMGSAMIAAVSIGLSIDGSVHFLAAYLRRKRRGHPGPSAAIHAAGGIGLPVVLATIALVVGFSVIASSEFVPTATFGILVAGTLAIGTAVNLSVLPALVVLSDRPEASRNRPPRNEPHP